MNWTASLLRNQLGKQKLFYEERINLLTNASIDVQNFLLLEEKVKELEGNLKTSEQKFKEVQNELKNKEDLSSHQLEVKETELTNLKEKIKEDKDKIFNLQKEIRELNLYHQRDLKQVKESYQAKLTPLQRQVAELKLSLLSLPNKKTKDQSENLQTQWNKEKEQIEKNHSVQITKLNKDYQLLQKQAKKTEKQLEKLTKKQSKTEQSLTNSQLIFTELEKLIDKTTITPNSKKKIRGKITEFKQLLGWGENSISESEEEIISSPEISPFAEFSESSLAAWELAKKPTAKEKRWQNINSNFTLELIKAWESKGFTLEECRSWININSPQAQQQAIYDSAYYAWLRDIKKVDAEWVLNHGNAEQLRQEFNAYDKR